jgi:hypothetical protein
VTASLAGPKYTVRPWESSSSRSKEANICDDGWWMDDTTVRPEVARDLSASMSVSAVLLSSCHTHDARQASADTCMSVGYSAGMQLQQRSHP